MTTKETQLLKLDIRLRQVVEKHTQKTRRNAELEELTEIPAMVWAQWWAGRSKPSSEMLMRICIKFPEISLWLLTGAEDPIGGQISPNTPTQREQKSATRLLRRLTEIYELKNEEVGYSLSEDEVNELNDLSEMRKKELIRKINQLETPSLTNTDEKIAAKVDDLIARIQSGWTFNDCVNAKYIGLNNQISPQDPKRQILKIGITAFQKKLNLYSAYVIEKQRLLESKKTQELNALEEAKHLLNLKSSKEI